MLVAQKEVEAPQRLLERLAESRVRTDEIFNIVAPDSLYERPIPERHRIIFYLGHLEAFDWNLLRDRILGVKAFDADLDKLFAFGIDPVNGKLPTDQPGDWPSLAATRGYVHRIRESIDAGLAALDFSECEFHSRRSRLFPKQTAQRRYRAPAHACGNFGVHASPVAD